MGRVCCFGSDVLFAPAALWPTQPPDASAVPPSFAIDRYFRVTFMSHDLATFWYDMFRELMYQHTNDGDLDEDVYDEE